MSTFESNQRLFTKHMRLQVIRFKFCKTNIGSDQSLGKENFAKQRRIFPLMNIHGFRPRDLSSVGKDNT